MTKNDKRLAHWKLRNETIKITMCEVYKNNRRIGQGFTITRSNGGTIGNWADVNGNELESGEYEVRHSDEEYLGNACWIMQ